MKPIGLFVVCLFLVAINVAGAASIKFDGVIPGAGVVTIQVQSMQELRYADIVRQETDFSCGAAALATILRYGYQRDVTEKDVLDGMMAISDPEVVRQRGFSLLDMKRYVKQLGMRGRGYRVGMQGVALLKVPTIILLDIRGYKHFVVLKKVDGEDVYLADPALGNKVIPISDLENNWNGIAFAIIGRGFDRQTVLLSPRGVPTVRRFQLSAPLTDADLLEFGFSHADLF
jgi:predicted double-glycine peptidase